MIQRGFPVISNIVLLIVYDIYTGQRAKITTDSACNRSHDTLMYCTYTLSPFSQNDLFIQDIITNVKDLHLSIVIAKEIISIPCFADDIIIMP